MRSRTRSALVLAIVVSGGLMLYAQWPVGRAPLGEADKVVVFKSEHIMTLLRNGVPLRTYHVSIGRNPVGAKTEAGDHKTPEGLYVLDWRNPQSKFHRSLHISYPNHQDEIRAQRLGVQPGGEIMIHGLENGLGWIGRFHRLADWTDGCIAVTDAEMDQIWVTVPNGTPIEIRP